MKDGSAFARNLASQPALLAAILDGPAAPFPLPRPGGRLLFIGTGANHHVAQIARWLWSRHGTGRAEAWASFDFVRLPARPGPRDVAAILSHRGTKAFSRLALDAAARAGAKTVLLTAYGSPVPRGTVAVETCEPEETGAYTKSATSTLAWIARWTGSRRLRAAMRAASRRVGGGPRMPRLSAGTDLVLVGDGPREWVARETALKIFETAHLPVRAFGLEEFLHGPRLSLGTRSRVIGFLDRGEPRWEAARRYLRGVGVPFTAVQGGRGDAGWLPQLYWGQRLALHAARRLGRDPDRLRNDEPRWRRARQRLVL